MFMTARHLLLIPAMVLVSAGPIQAGSKFFTNLTGDDFTITLVAGKETVTAPVKRGETRVLDYKPVFADLIRVDTSAGSKTLKDEDGINTNTQFYFTAKGLKMSPMGPLDRMMRSKEKKKPPKAAEKEKADRAADEKTTNELMAEPGR